MMHANLGLVPKDVHKFRSERRTQILSLVGIASELPLSCLCRTVLLLNFSSNLVIRCDEVTK